LATLAYTGNVNDPTPEFLVRIPRQVIVPITQAFPQGIFTCTANYNLQPYETKDLDFKLHVAAPVLRSDEVLIILISIDLIHILPRGGKEQEFDTVYNCYIGKGCIVNLSNNVLQGEIVGKYEIYEIYEILGPYTQVSH
jgi:hypothetical protein